jgi:hypothetical protein
MRIVPIRAGSFGEILGDDWKRTSCFCEIVVVFSKGTTFGRSGQVIPRRRHFAPPLSFDGMVLRRKVEGGGRKAFFHREGTKDAKIE